MLRKPGFWGVSPRLRAFWLVSGTGLSGSIPDQSPSGGAGWGGHPGPGSWQPLSPVCPGRGRALSAGAGDAVGRRTGHGHSGARGVTGRAGPLPSLPRGCRSPALPRSPAQLLPHFWGVSLALTPLHPCCAGPGHARPAQPAPPRLINPPGLITASLAPDAPPKPAAPQPGGQQGAGGSAPTPPGFRGR